MAAPDRPEFDRGDARVKEADSVRRSVTADRYPVLGRPVGDDRRQRLHVRVVPVDHRGLARVDDLHLGVGDRADGVQDLAAFLAWQVADVDVDRAEVRNAVDAIAAEYPAEADRRPVEELRRLPRERQRLDLAEDVDRLQDGVVAEPRRGAVRGGAAHLYADGEDALRLYADSEVGRLAGDREVAQVALRHDVVRPAVLRLVRLLVRHAHEVN